MSNNDWVIRVCARETAACFWLVAWVFSFGSIDFRLYLVGYPTMTGSFTRVARETTGFVFCFFPLLFVGVWVRWFRQAFESAWGAVGVKRNKRANGVLLRGEVFQQMPVGRV